MVLFLSHYSFTFKLLHQLKSNTYCSCWESFLGGLNPGFSFIAQTFKSLFLGNGPNLFWFMSIYSLGTLLNHFEAISTQSRIEKFLTSCCVFVQIPIDINREKKVYRDDKNVHSTPLWTRKREKPTLLQLDNFFFSYNFFSRNFWVCFCTNSFRP